MVQRRGEKVRPRVGAGRGPVASTPALLGLGLLCVALYYVAPNGGGWQAIPYLTMAWAAPISIAIGIRRHHPTVVRGWVLIGWASLLWAVGESVWYFEFLGLGVAEPFGWPDIFYLSSVVVLTCGMRAFLRAKNPSASLETMLDGVVLAAAGAAVLWYFSLGEHIGPTGSSVAVRVLVVLYPLVDLLLFALAARLAFLGHDGNRSSVLLMVSMVSLLVADIGFAIVLQHVGTEPLWVDAGWLTFFTFLAAAALHPSMAGVAHKPIQARAPSLAHVALVGSAALVGPFLALHQAFSESSALEVGLETITVATVGAVVWQVSLIARDRVRHEEHNRDRVLQEERLRRAAQRQRANAEISATIVEASFEAGPLIEAVLAQTADAVQATCVMVSCPADGTIVTSPTSQATPLVVGAIEYDLCVAAGVMRPSMVVVSGGIRDLDESESGWAVAFPIQAEVTPKRVFVAVRDSGQPPFDAEDYAFLRNIADRTNLALENCRLFLDLRHELSERRRGEEILRESERRWRAFGTEASHQLRTPLTGLRLRIDNELADTRRDTPTPTEWRQILAETRQHLDDLESTVHDFLNLVPSRHVSVEPLDVAVLLDDVAASWGSLIAVSGREFTLRAEDNLPRALISGAAVRQVLAVLLDNALRHGGGGITLVAKELAGAVVLEVHDEGPGFGDTNAAREPRPSNGNGNGNGNGSGNGNGNGTGARGNIGLALARSLAEAEGARLQLSNPGPSPSVSLFLPGWSSDAEPVRDS